MPATETLVDPHRANQSQGLAEDSLYEVVDGIHVEQPAMSIYANRVATRLQRTLARVAEEGGLGTVTIESLFILDAESDLRRRPDVAFVSAATWPLDRPLPETGDWEVVPDLCIEVVSPHDLFDTVTRKLQEYFACGVREVWILWPEAREVHVYRSREQFKIHGEQATLISELLPGVRLPVADLFQRLPAAAG
jgi:Uma2 family endonuclease